MTPEQAFLETLRAVDAALARGLAAAKRGPDDQRLGEGAEMSELELQLPQAGFRTLVLRLLQRHGLRVVSKPKQRSPRFYVIASDAVCAEVLEPELGRLAGAVDEFVSASLAGAADAVLGAKPR